MPTAPNSSEPTMESPSATSWGATPLLDHWHLQPNERFDRIACIDMCWHVSMANLDRHFSQHRQLRAPGGLLLNHSITAGSVHSNPMGTSPSEFIEAHIFPGGELVHVSEQTCSLSAGGLELLNTKNLRPHYARALWDWSNALEGRLDEARDLAGEAFVRAYRLYLKGSAMAFEHGWLSIHQLLASRSAGDLGTGSLRSAQSAYPFNRGDMYREPDLAEVGAGDGTGGLRQLRLDRAPIRQRIALAQ